MALKVGTDPRRGHGRDEADVRSTTRDPRGRRSEIAPEPLDGKVPPGAIEHKWDDHKGHLKLVNPNNKRKFTILVVGK